MKRLLTVTLATGAAVLIGWNWIQSAPLQTGAAPAAGLTSFRIIFGARQERSADYSGGISLTGGRLVRVAPWRFFGGDAVQPPDKWKLTIKRTQLESQPDQPRPLSTPGMIPQLSPAGVTVTVDAPAAGSAHLTTAQGAFDFKMSDLASGRGLSFLDGDVLVYRAPTPQEISRAADGQNDYPSIAVTKSGTVWVAWQSYSKLGDHVFARHSTPAGWSEPFRLTDGKGDVFHTAVAEDGQGRVWVVWSERSGEDWDLYGRSYDGRQWTARRKVTSGDRPNIFHRLVADSTGGLHLVWTAHRNGQSLVLWSKQQGDGFASPVDVSGDSAWAPDAAADSQGNLFVAWDSYRTGNYDIFLRRIGRDGSLGPAQQVTRSPRFQAHVSVTVDKRDRPWIAWDESGSNWGKDWSHEDQWRSTVLYSDRRLRIATLENGAWKQPAGDLMAAVPKQYNRYVENPRITSDAAGRIWVAFQVRTSSGMNRTDFWASNGRWEHFVTGYDGSRWIPAIPVPNTSSRPDGMFQIVRAGEGIWSAWVNDNRGFGAAGGFGANPGSKYEIDAASFSLPAPGAEAALEAFAETPGSAAGIHEKEKEDVARIRGYRSTVGGTQLRILRGDFHRHTEISGDGAGDGSVEDYFRYMLDAAAMDTGVITDHNAGGDDEYTWWRTEKAHDLFHIRGRYTPLFGYERSVSYPNGHRNVVFAQRGVRTLPIGRDENQGQVNSGPILYPYLKQNRGIAMLHSLATGQGSDYRDNDPTVEPLVELYQGYHAAYEYPGSPRAETDEYQVSVHGGYRPLGFFWNALKKGYKLGVQASSDHIATHNSYTLIYSPSVAREAIVESMRKRHAYGATDNIILDFRCGEHMMGDSFTAPGSPRFQVKVIGTAPIAKVEIIKDGKFVFDTQPAGSTADFSYVDANPGAGESWYYVRVIQTDRNLAWSSPMWIKH
ncbi:MAG TPA: hypothetical protein VL285_09885 [Bryobacteraceae bacterium]|nr:hypothetical protein [Bryobacteraceae bacterium]